MATQTHYEVHVLQGSRWSIHAQFASGEKDLAVDEGKLQDGQAGIDAVKVIREVYDPAESTHRDFVIYKSLDFSSARKEAETVGSSKSHGHKSNRENDDDWFDEDGFDNDDDGKSFGDDQWSDSASKKRKKKKKNPNRKETTVTRVLIKLLLVTLISISLAGVLTVITSNVLHDTILFGNRMQGNFEANVLFVVFVSTFILSAASLTIAQLKGTTLAKESIKQQPKTPLHPQSVNSPPKEITKTNKTKEEALNTRDELGAAMEGIQDFGIDEQLKSAAEDATDERLKSAIKDDESSSDSDKQEETLKTDGREPVETLSPHAEKQKKYMMDFLTTTLKSSGTDQEKLDNFNKFGVNLFLAGACEILSYTSKLDEKSRDKVLSDSVRVMGFKKSHASSFAGKYEDYLMQDPRYMQIFQAGRNAMNTYLQDEKSASRHLKTALEEWNKPKKKAEKAGPVTVLFTDIAGSTAMTQALGDEGAQKVVRAHNRVVREALTDWNGKEIKHTGDGIMASFARITDSVDASIQMQRETNTYNEQTPELPLHLKIGLNAGEPIVEDNDLFGTVVQMAARIVDKAKADQIFVSDIIRGICVGKSYNFINRGGFTMKGFDEDPTLYEVVWRDDDAAAE